MVTTRQEWYFLKNVSPAYEDVFYFLWAEGKNPVNIDPLKANLKDPLERRTLAKLLNEGLGDPVGYVLPLQWKLGQGFSFIERQKRMIIVAGMETYY